MAHEHVAINRYVINNDDVYPNPNTPKTFRDAAESYVRNRGEHRYLPRIIAYFGDTPLAMISPFDVQEMAQAVLPPGVKNVTLNREAITPARAVINHGYSRRWCNYLHVKNFRAEKPKERIPATELWMHLFVRQCEQEKAYHVAGLILFMAMTGARVSEAVGLEWPDVDLQARTVVLVKTKTETNSVRHLTDALIVRMQDLRSRRSSRNPERVFHYKCRYSVNERIKLLCEHAGIEYKSSHVCGRYTYANWAIAMGIDVPTAMAGGGWKSSAVFLGVYVKARRNSGRIVADRFNQHLFDGQ